jgi:hypothetical protein
MIAELAELIRENQPWVVLTGAGVSTERISESPKVALLRYKRGHTLR